MRKDDPTVDGRPGKQLTPLPDGHTLDLDGAETIDATVSPGPALSLAPRRLPAGATVGRYRIDRVIGEGGMGVVYLAHDPDLDRPVALKLVRYAGHGSGGSDGRARMLREAQALAKLSHPSVVSIYDVGSYGDGVFLAMEFVDGSSFKHWMTDDAPTTDELIAALVSAGRGLAAAHRAGLIHRDVKPDNIFRWRDGRIAIGDFGLARADADIASEDGREIDESQPVFVSLTHTGAILGTPPYMAPEQHEGESADLRSDQFSFCVTAWEALHGERPFAGDDLATVRDTITRGILTEPTGGRALPRRIDRALRRGLSRDAAARYPSMDALLDDLAPPPRRAPIGLIAAGVGFAAAAAAVLALSLGGGADRDRCAAGAAKLADVWGPEHERAARDAFAAAGTAYAESVWPRVADAVDDYGRRFAAQYRDACEDTNVRGEYDREVLATRNACLDSRLGELANLARLFARADAATARGAVDAVTALGAPEDCGDVAALLAATPPPGEPALRSRVDALDSELGRALALSRVARTADALAVVEPMVADTDHLGYRPLEARVRLHAGTFMRREGRYDRADELLRDAVFRAEAGRADRVAAEAWIERVDNAYQKADYDQALEHAVRARAAVERLGDPAELRADLHNAVGTVYRDQARWDDAEREHRAALAASTGASDGAAVHARASALRGLAFVDYRRGKLDDSIARYREALALLEETYGPNHPAVADTLLGLCIAHEAAGSFDRVFALYDRALAIVEGAFGADHIRTAETLTVIGGTYHARGRHRDALATNRRALAIREAHTGREHPAVAQNLTNIAIALKNLGQLDDAVKTYAEAGRIYEAVHGADHFAVGVVENNLAEALRVKGAPADALPHYQRSLAVLEKNAGADALVLAHPLTGIGESQVDLGRARDAIAPLERALALRSAGHTNPVDLAQTRFALARARWNLGERARARVLARLAEEGYRAQGEGRAADADRVAAWRARH